MIARMTFLGLNRSLSLWCANDWPYRREGVGSLYVERLMELATPGDLRSDEL